MVDKIETMLLLLGVVSVLAVIAAKLRFPFPILLVIAGLLIGLTPGLPIVHLDPDIIFLIVLPPLLFSAAWNFSWEHLRSNLMPILGMAVGLVFMTIVAVGYAVHWMIPGVTLATGFVLGAIISPPDAVAASAILKNLRVPKRLMAILEGESLVNDASGLVAYHFAVLAVVTGTFSAGQAGLDFLWMAGCGTAVGLVCGMVVVRMHQTLKDPSVGITLTIITPYVVYLLAEKFESSGILAVVAAGLYIGNRSWRVLSADSRLMRDTIWSFIDYILNGLVFILIGLQFPVIVQQIDTIYIWEAVLIGVAVSAIILVVRFIWMYPMARLERYIRLRSVEPQEAITTKGMAVASWAGMRGVVSLATALALPWTIESGEHFPYRNTIQFITFVVIFITLVFQGLSLPWLVRKLGVEDSGTDIGAMNKARDALLETVIRRVDEEIARTEDESDRRSLEIWQKQFIDRVERLHELNTSEDVEPNWDKILILLPKLYTEARRELAQLYMTGKISEDIRRTLLFEMDVEEERLKHLVRTHQKK